MSEIADSPGALTGVRIIDAATLAAGPLVATAMGELGAEVIKIEQPLVGDPMRRWGEMKDGIGLVWKSISRNKQCITLDLRLEGGQGLLHQLLERSDVLIVNNRPSALLRWGLAPDDLIECHPHLIVVHISVFGQGSPMSDRPGFGTLAEAMSGFAHIVGQAGQPPTLPPFMLADGVASMVATYATLAALYHRDVHGGRGQHIDVNLIEPLARLVESATLTFDQLGWSPSRAGNRWDTSAPRNTYETSDDHWIAMSSATSAIARRVFQAIGRPDWAEDIAFVDQIHRRDKADEIDAEVAAWIGQRTLSEVMKVFEQNEVAAAPVYNAEQLLADSHLRARNTFPTLDDPDIGPIRVQAPVARLSSTPARIEHLGRHLGSGNRAVYQGLLGLSDDELATLSQRGII